MTTQEKLNNVLGYLTAMSFDKPELSNDLVEPIRTLSAAIIEVENLSLSGVVGQSEQLACECIAWCVGESELKESHKCEDKFVTKG